MTCPACGAVLPPWARFCAVCGRPQQARAAPPVADLVPDPGAPGGSRIAYPAWLVVLFSAGGLLAAVLAIVYAVIAWAPPEVPGGPPMDPAQLRATSLLLAVYGAVLFALHTATLAGFARRAAWARVTASAAAAAWALTCVAIPISIAVLVVAWRSPRGGAR